MIPKRNRSMHVSVGLMTALSLGVASLAGCASFDPNPASTGQTSTVTATQPTTGQPAATGGQTATPTITQPAAPVATSLIGGKVEVAGKPLANATITVYNAFTNKAVAGLVAAGAGNLVAAGAGNLVAAGAGNYGLTQTTIKTDAEGNYSFEVPEIAAGDVLRVVATGADGVPLSNLVNGAAPTSTYELAQATTTGGTSTTSTSTTTTSGRTSTTTTTTTKKKSSFSIKINLGTTLSVNTMNGALQMLGAVTNPRLRLPGIDRAMANIDAISNRLQTNLALRPDVQNQVLAHLAAVRDRLAGHTIGGGTSEGLVDAETFTATQIQQALADSGLKDATDSDDIQALFTATMNVVRTAAASSELNQNTVLTLTADDFPPSINIDLSKLEDGGTFSFTDPVTGKVISGEVTIVEEIVEETVEVTEENLPDSIADAAKLSPDVTIEYDESDPNSKLKMTVTQGSSEFDIESIEAKLPMTYVKNHDFLASNVLNDAADTSISDGWTDFATPSGHTITKTSATTDSFNGVWKDNSGSPRTIANVAVKIEGGFMVVTIDFAMSGNDYVHTRGGTAVMEALTSMIELDPILLEAAFAKTANNIVEISITTRDGLDTTATGDDTITGSSVLLGRPIKYIP